MGTAAIYRRQATSKPAPGHESGGGITYIPMARGFVYLVAVVDWFTRRVLHWVSITMAAGFCFEALEEAVGKYSKGAWRDNIFVERLRRLVTYEQVYLKAYDTVAEPRASLNRYLDFFNRHCPHSSLNWKMPDEAHFIPRPVAAST